MILNIHDVKPKIKLKIKISINLNKNLDKLILTAHTSQWSSISKVVQESHMVISKGKGRNQKLLPNALFFSTIAMPK